MLLSSWIAPHCCYRRWAKEVRCFVTGIFYKLKLLCVMIAVKVIWWTLGRKESLKILDRVLGEYKLSLVQYTQRHDSFQGRVAFHQGSLESRSFLNFVYEDKLAGLVDNLCSEIRVRSGIAEKNDGMRGELWKTWLNGGWRRFRWCVVQQKVNGCD